jgi:hypothetical protein
MGLQLIEEKLSLLEKVAIFRYKRSEKKKSVGWLVELIFWDIGRFLHTLIYWSTGPCPYIKYI